MLTSIGMSVSRATAVALNVWFQTDSPEKQSRKHQATVNRNAKILYLLIYNTKEDGEKECMHPYN